MTTAQRTLDAARSYLEQYQAAVLDLEPEEPCEWCEFFAKLYIPTISGGRGNRNLQMPGSEIENRLCMNCGRSLK
jgi:hypothetical protein